MKKQNRILFAVSVAALLVAGVGVAFGATNPIYNLTDVNEAYENDTPTERAIETGEIPINITVDPPVETTIEPAIPVSTSKPTPGFGTLMTLSVVLSTIYIFGKRR